MPRIIHDAGHWEVLLLQVQLVNKAVNFFLSLFSGVAITLLHYANQFVELTVDSFQVIIGQLSPPFFGFAANLGPFSGQYISIESYVHLRTPFLCFNLT